MAGEGQAACAGVAARWLLRESTGSKRKLAAILAADVGGYSRLMGADEAGTAQALRSIALRSDRGEFRRVQVGVRGADAGAGGEDGAANGATVIEDVVDSTIRLRSSKRCSHVPRRATGGLRLAVRPQSL